MRTSARTGMALAVAGAAGGVTLLTGGAAQAAATAAHDTAVAKVCRYEVTARDGLRVRTGPGTKYRVVGKLPHRKHISADCKSTGWTRLRGSVPEMFLNKWVSRKWLKPIRPSGGVGTGGGGTSTHTNPLLAGAGAGIIALGGGAAIVARRRQVKGVS